MHAVRLGLGLALIVAMMACGNNPGVVAPRLTASGVAARGMPVQTPSTSAAPAAEARGTVSLADTTLVLFRPSRPARPIAAASPAAAISGQYAFSFTGADANGLLQIAGSFQADGQGNIANGVEDENSGTGVSLYSGFTGTYTVAQDGRGSLTLSTSGGVQNFEIAVVSSTRALIIRFDTSALGSGSMELQDPAAFTTSALSGTFVFSLSGEDFVISSQGAPVSSVGVLALDGTGSVSSGTRDDNESGTVALSQTFTGGYSVSSNGRGTATWTDARGTLHFTFYVVSAHKILLTSTDVSRVWLGSAEAQQGITSAGLTGPFVYSVGGASTLGTIAEAAQFTVSGGGTSLSGTGDQNNEGTVTSGFALTGFYSMSSNGHGTLALTNANLGTANYSFYQVTPARAVLMRTDSTVVASGTLFQQQSGAFANNSISGPYASGVSGISGSTSGPIPIVEVGQVTADGNGSLSGTEDIDAGGGLTSDVALTGSYSVASTGRATFSVSGGGVARMLAAYLVSPQQMLLVGLDTDQVLFGEASLQTLSGQ